MTPPVNLMFWSSIRLVERLMEVQLFPASFSSFGAWSVLTILLTESRSLSHPKEQQSYTSWSSLITKPLTPRKTLGSVPRDTKQRTFKMSNLVKVWPFVSYLGFCVSKSKWKKRGKVPHKWDSVLQWENLKQPWDLHVTIGKPPSNDI